MSGLFSAVGKIFTPVVSGISRLGSAITGVGATAFTSAAASGSTINALGTAFAKGAGAGLAGGATAGAFGSTLSSILSGVGGVLTPAILGGSTTSATGGAAAAAGDGTGGGAASTLGNAFAGGVANMPGTPTGMAPTGKTGFGAILDKLGISEGMAGDLLAGVGKGIGDYEQMQALKERDQALYDFKNQQQAHTEQTYHVDPNSMAGGTPLTGDRSNQYPTPEQKYTRGNVTYRYDPGTRRIVPVRAA